MVHSLTRLPLLPSRLHPTNGSFNLVFVLLLLLLLFPQSCLVHTKINEKVFEFSATCRPIAGRGRKIADHGDSDSRGHGRESSMNGRGDLRGDRNRTIIASTSSAHKVHTAVTDYPCLRQPLFPSPSCGVLRTRKLRCTVMMIFGYPSTQASRKTNDELWCVDIP